MPKFYIMVITNGISLMRSLPTDGELDLHLGDELTNTLDVGGQYFATALIVLYGEKRE